MHVTMDPTRGGRGVGVDGRAFRRAAALVVAVVVLAGCTSSDEPAASEEQALAIQLCKEIDALAAVNADPERILYPAVMLSHEVWNRDLDEELFTDEVLARCGPIIEAAAAAEEARSDQARALADLVVVTIDRCDDSGASGTVTNASDRTVTSAWIDLIVLADDGMGYSEVEGISIGNVHDPNSIAVLGPGESAQWSMMLEEHHRYDWMGNPLGSVAACEVGHINVGGSE
jgi:hypothetical protein